MEKTQCVELLFREKCELEQLVINLTAENQQLRQQLADKEQSELLFADWILEWLAGKQTQVKSSTYDEYCIQVKKHIEPYFRSTGLSLSEITPHELEKYYALKYSQGLSGTTLAKHHSNINSALKGAVRNNLIPGNPADVCQRPKKQKYQAAFLTSEQFQKVLSAINEPVVRTAVFLAGSLGLRRSEVLGLRWNDIDFEAKSVCIQHTLTRGIANGSNILVSSDIPKTKTSRRTLPLPAAVLEYLCAAKIIAKMNYEKNKKSFITRYKEYICIDEYGNILMPNRLSKCFAYAVKSLGYKARFHDLRHTCASLLIQNGVPMKYVSQWLGHSSIGITSDTYVHLTYKDKQLVADKIDNILAFGGSRTQPQQSAE